MKSCIPLNDRINRMPRRAYPSDVTEEWLFVSPCLTLMREDAPRSAGHDLREVFTACVG